MATNSREEIERYRSHLNEYPCDAGARFQLALALKETGQIGAALNAFRDYLDMHPGSPEALLEINTLLYQLQRYDQAETGYLEYLQQIPESIEALHGLAHCLLAQNRIPEVLNHLEHALRLHPEDPTLRRLREKLQPSPGSV